MLGSVSVEGAWEGERGHARGHTLVELVTVLSLLALSASLAYPSLAALRRGQEAEAAAIELLCALRGSQWRSVVSGRPMRVVPRCDGATWRYGVERAEGAAWVAASAERRLPAGIALQSAGPAEKVFYPDGTSSVGSITLIAAGGMTYRFTLTPATGRVRFYRGAREAARG